MAEFAKELGGAGRRGAGRIAAMIGARAAVAAFLENPSNRASAHAAAYEVLRSRADAREIVAQAVLHAWESADLYRGGAAISTWFIVIARNLALQELRRRDIAKRYLASQPPPSVCRTPESDAIAQEGAELLRRAVRCLPPKYSGVIKHVYFDELTLEQAAERLGITYSACRSRVYQAREIMRSRIVGWLR
jgi:RNA polymerase sigma-70 factor, ECF subfamily